MTYHSRNTVQAIAIAVLVGLTARSTAARPLVIRLRPVVEVSQREVRLSDIAHLSTTGVTNIPDDVGDADLAVIPQKDRMVLIDKSVIDVRLRLRGLEQDDYLLLGPDQLIVSLVEAGAERKRDSRFSLVSLTRRDDSPRPNAPVEVLSDMAVEQEIQSSLARQFELAPAEVKAQLLRPFVDDRLRSQAQAGRIEVICPPDFPYGRTNLMVRCWDGDQLVTSRTAFTDVRRRQQVLVSLKTLGRTTSVTEDDVVQEIRYVDGYRDELRPADVVGLSPLHTIRAGEVLSLRDFPAPQSQQLSEQLIRSRDAVRIVGHRKGLQFIVPAAEALQSGRMGQLIRVRNLHSQKIVLGRVTGRGEVEVALE